MDQSNAIYHAAIESLRRCCCQLGLKASGGRLGHQQIWARDSMIALLGARFVPDSQIQDALRASLTLLRDHGTSGGAIPSNVDCATLRPNFRAYADGGLWWAIGSMSLAPDPETVRAVLRWYEYQDVDQSGLLSMQESSDWQDLFCTRGKGLYLNCLYVLALRCAAELFDGEEGDSFAAGPVVSDRINSSFGTRRQEYSAASFSRSVPSVPGKTHWAAPMDTCERYWLISVLLYLGFLSVGECFDSFGNLFAILSGVADQPQTDIILDFISRHSLDTWPLRSLTPVVCPGDADWRDYYGSLNAPHHYHNGGVWPFLGGFHIAALVKAGRRDVAGATWRRLAELNQAGQFNEWHHGETGEPMGVQDQAWSAGMYLFACECMRRNRVILP